MKSSILLLTIQLILIPLSLSGQEKKSKLADYNWEENRPRYTLTTDEENLPSIVLLNKTVSEYIFENNAFVQYSVDHMILRVNTDEAIAGANKISVSMVNTIEVVNIKARAISKDGKRINLDKNNIKEIKEDENSSASKIFAIEGVEKGSEIEYFYVKKTLPSIYGFDVFQFSSPVKEAIFQLLSPEHLTFKFKCYNGYPMVKDSTFDGKNIYTAHLRNIPELKDEPSSNYRKNQIRMEYKLAVNKAKSMKEMYTWNDIAQSQYQELFTYSGKETKAVQKLFGDLKLKTTDIEPEKIKTIENFVKTNFIIQEIYKNDDSSLDKIIHNKFANKSGIIKLYIALFNQAKIENQLVLTSERDHIYFDDTFESWRFLNNYLFYFPGTDKFLSPEEPALRYPIIPHNLTYVNGLFLKIINIGGYESFIPSVKFIPPLDYRSSSHNIDAEIEFIKDMSELNLKLSCTFRGYYGAYTQPYYSLIPDDKKVKALEDMVKDMTKDTKFIKLYAENTDPNINLIEKPFIIYAEVEGSSLIENAGNKILLKLGEVIGKQVEMYQEKNRLMEVEDQYNREFLRTIKVKIPEGYTIKNPDDIAKNIQFKRSDEVIYQFVSSYRIENNLLLVDINEFYKEITCPVNQFDQYRNVVNAAADFNKVTLVLEKN